MTSPMSTYDEETAYYKHDWELRAGDNSYAPPPFTAPWGEEEAVGGNNHRIESTSNEKSWPTPSSSRKQQSTYTSRRRQNRQQWNDTPDDIPRPSAHNSWKRMNPYLRAQVFRPLTVVGMITSWKGIAPSVHLPWHPTNH